YRLVNHVTESGKALDKARELAGAICAAAPLPVMFIKSSVDSGLDMTRADAMSAEGDASFMLYFSKDRDEGLAAFKEKRTPKFRGE
ncbi:MAG TPA: enoyl-CoA hydratase-related protein, partial [Noviherbaspirillum sp.]|nr:enoyl-CoA hydratase-related protein [Noviherbaspirillum sp.]